MKFMPIHMEFERRVVGGQFANDKTDRALVNGSEPDVVPCRFWDCSVLKKNSGESCSDERKGLAILGAIFSEIEEK
jgi:hypothetical protein